MASYLGTGANNPGDVATTGKLGVGTTSPRSSLHVESTSSADGMVTILNPTEGGEASLSFDTGTFDTTKRWVAGVGGWGNTNKFVIGRDTSPKLTIDTNGKVGIGTNSPQGILDVSGTSGGLVVPRLDQTQVGLLNPPNGTIIYNTTAQKFQGYANGAWVLL